MKLNIFAIADSVEIYNGKLVIIGLFDKFLANEMPTFTRPIGLAFKIQGEKKDYAKAYDGHIIFRKIGSKKNLIELPLTIKFQKPKDEAGSNFVGALQIGPLKLISWGKYVLELKVASKVIGSTSFFAVKRQKEATKKKPKKKAKKKATKKKT